MSPYPQIVLPPHLERIREKLAENIHELWALTRIEQGWTYGPVSLDLRGTSENGREDQSLGLEDTKESLGCKWQKYRWEINGAASRSRGMKGSPKIDPSVSLGSR